MWHAGAPEGQKGRQIEGGRQTWPVWKSVFIRSSGAVAVRLSAPAANPAPSIPALPGSVEQS